MHSTKSIHTSTDRQWKYGIILLNTSQKVNKLCKHEPVPAVIYNPIHIQMNVFWSWQDRELDREKELYTPNSVLQKKI